MSFPLFQHLNHRFLRCCADIFVLQGFLELFLVLVGEGGLEDLTAELGHLRQHFVLGRFNHQDEQG